MLTSSLVGGSDSYPLFIGWLAEAEAVGCLAFKNSTSTIPAGLLGFSISYKESNFSEGDHDNKILVGESKPDLYA